jgi:hypothetical protein
MPMHGIVLLDRISRTVPASGQYEARTTGGVVLTQPKWCVKGNGWPSTNLTLAGVRVEWVPVTDTA